MIELLPSDKLKEMKHRLLNELKKIEIQLRIVETSDSLTPHAIPESSELATASWEADVQAGALAIKNRLVELADKVNKTLKKLEQGTYGICDKCKSLIDPQRLEVFPMATNCRGC